MTSAEPHRHVIAFDKIHQCDIATVGAKAANLGELSRLDGIRVPTGFVVTTDAFSWLVDDHPTIGDQLEQLNELAELASDDSDALRATAAEIRQRIESSTIAEDIASEITDAVERLGEQTAWAVRSSATAEDLPTASFAGQHDSSLNVIGAPAVLDHVRRCWGSLFTERAVTYRNRHGIDHRRVQMAVIVQHMATPRASGVLFTADPVTSNRTVCSIEATFGLGEALVSGLVNPDVYTVRGEGDIETSIGTKAVAIEPASSGGTRTADVEPERQRQPVLTEGEVRELVTSGRRIEAHFAAPQDIEWCTVDDGIAIVQSRPITTLFPIPHSDDEANHVYVSVGHQQMMTDPMKPLGLSFWLKTTPAPMVEAGGRLFVDITARLGTPEGGAALFDLLGRSDPLITDALQTVLDRGDFVASTTEDAPGVAPAFSSASAPLETDPAVVDELIGQWQASTAQLRHDIGSISGPELFEFIARDITELRQMLFEPRSLQVIMEAIDATWWLNDHISEWLGERNVADTLTQSAPNNVTSEMGLALLDVADAIRPHPEVIDHLRHLSTDTDSLLQDIEKLPGGQEARGAIEGFLNEFGMRCVGEIDITRPRWAEHPAALVPVLLGHISNFEPGEAKRRFERGRREAAAKEEQILTRLQSLPDGQAKAAETKSKIDRVRTFIGYREYPKYAWISRTLEYKRALLAEAERLHRTGVVDHVEDIYYLSFDELQEAVRTRHVDAEIIAARREAFTVYETLNPPRVLTSEGEALTGRYHHDDLPAGALPGNGVSAGVVEGRARVVHTMADADIAPGDILVTTHTDPSWSPLFVAISGLVTEVGGLMTHGAVVAREYGLPTVVGVELATRHIQDGQRIRLDGTHGYVEVLPS